MDEITRVGIDLAKKVVHVTAVDGAATVLDYKRLSRGELQSYLAQLPRGRVVAMEVCGSAHHWVRVAMRLGHEAVLNESLVRRALHKVERERRQRRGRDRRGVWAAHDGIRGVKSVTQGQASSTSA